MQKVSNFIEHGGGGSKNGGGDGGEEQPLSKFDAITTDMFKMLKKL